MLTFGQPAPASEGAIVDGSDATFMQDVVEASQEVAVIVDFWAPWCGPCKQLTPALEAAVREAGGKAKLVKINVDENPQIAAQLRVQSIPTVFAFAGGQPVDGFAGAQPPAKIKEFVQKAAAQVGLGGVEEVLARADESLEKGEVVEAAQVYSAVLQELQTEMRAAAGLIRCYILMGDLEKAEGLLAACPDPDHPHLAGAVAQLEMAKSAGDAGEAAQYRARLEADPNDHDARFELSAALMAANDPEAAIAELLELFRRDREWNDGAAKTQLFKVFDSLGPKSPVAQAGRRKLSSLIFL